MAQKRIFGALYVCLSYGEVRAANLLGFLRTLDFLLALRWIETIL
jgi:hypothetical protein